jgi:hypothetical protein
MKVHRPVVKAGMCLCVLLAIVWNAPSLHSQKTIGKSRVSNTKAELAQCKSSYPGFTDSQCTTLVKRTDYVKNTDCPDRDAYYACKSFRELVKAQDADIVRDLAQQDHIYACFRPEDDVFSEVVFSNPASSTVASHEGTVAINYYKSGVKSSDMSIRNTGQWKSVAASQPISFDAPHRLPVGATFQGDNIRIQDARLEATETYKNTDGLDTTHTYTLQLSTGRFIETYEVQAPNKTEYPGRCLVMPNPE